LPAARWKPPLWGLGDAGLALDSVPRGVAKSGSAQDAAQLTAIENAATGAAVLPLSEDLLRNDSEPVLVAASPEHPVSRVISELASGL
jgi:hypothetical protein